MRSLDARIEELERRRPSDDTAPAIVVTSLTKAGEDAQAIEALRDSASGRVWTKRHDESEEAFMERASREARTDPWQTPLLFADAHATRGTSVVDA